MRRRTFDQIVAWMGALLVVGLVVTGSLLMWGYNFANSQVSSQLAEQKIVFPTANSPELTTTAIERTQIAPYMDKYAGQPLTTGAQAETYADHFIKVHIDEMGYTYSQISTLAMSAPKGSAEAAKYSALESTIFQGTTLRSMLLEAYGFWQMGQIALVAAICAYIAAAIMLVLTVFGFVHAKRTPHTAEI